jgi:hypothetical protein
MAGAAEGLGGGAGRTGQGAAADAALCTPAVCERPRKSGSVQTWVGCDGHPVPDIIPLGQSGTGTYQGIAISPITSTFETDGFRVSYPYIMPDAVPLQSMPSVFSPLAKALLDGFSEGVVVFDPDGRVLYANQQAREALSGLDLSEHAPDLMPRLAALGGRLRPLRVGSLELGEAMFIPGIEGPTTLAAREKEAIVQTLDANNWKLAETAKHLGISRTTLWRRLKAYGLHRDGRSKWAQTS